MEMDDTTFPFSDITRLYEILSSKQNEIKTYFVTHHEGTGMLNQDGLEKCLKSLGLKLNSQELLTIWRKLDKKGNGTNATVSFTKLIKLASDDSYEFSTQSGEGTPNKN
jgi:Ca2+-binding EF-hand superfamily protein